jgi:PAS domain S-box-containing protein
LGAIAGVCNAILLTGSLLVMGKGVGNFVLPPLYNLIIVGSILLLAYQRVVHQFEIAARTLRESEERFFKAFHANPLRMSIATVADGRIVDINRAGADDLGRTRDELIGRPIGDFGVWADPGERERFVSQLLRDGRVEGFVSRGRNQAGELIDLLRYADRIELNGEACILAAGLDVTEEVRARAQIRELNASLEQRVNERTAALAAANRDLQVANRDLESFSYSVSHDLRAPLRAIRQCAQFLRDDHAAGLDDTGNSLLVRIERAATRMDSLITDLLAFSSTSRKEIRSERVDMRQLVSEVLADLEAATPDSALIEIGELPAAVGDPSLLRQVWLNLIGNALKFSGESQPPRIEIGSVAREGLSEYFVRDNGAGFDMAYAHKLFHVFQRLHAIDQFEGTGIGLAIVQRVVERHGGSVRAQGSPGLGATFYFTLGTASRDGRV